MRPSHQQHELSTRVMVTTEATHYCTYTFAYMYSCKSRAMFLKLCCVLQVKLYLYCWHLGKSHLQCKMCSEILLLMNHIVKANEVIFQLLPINCCHYSSLGIIHFTLLINPVVRFMCEALNSQQHTTHTH